MTEKSQVLQKIKKHIWNLTDTDTYPYPANLIKKFAIGVVTTSVSLGATIISTIWGNPIFIVLSAWGLAVGWLVVAHTLTLGEKYLERIKLIGKRKKRNK